MDNLHDRVHETSIIGFHEQNMAMNIIVSKGDFDTVFDLTVYLTWHILNWLIVYCMSLWLFFTLYTTKLISATCPVQAALSITNFS